MRRAFARRWMPVSASQVSRCQVQKARAKMITTRFGGACNSLGRRLRSACLGRGWESSFPVIRRLAACALELHGAPPTAVRFCRLSHWKKQEVR